MPVGLVERLSAYAWPGNVRELENLLERALVTTSGGQLVLPADFGARRASRAAVAAAPERYRDAQRRCIETALASAGGRVYGQGGAAALLAMKPTTLQSKMKKLGIQVMRRAARQ